MVLVSRKTPDSKAISSALGGSSYHVPFVEAAAPIAGGQSEVSALHELEDLPTKDRVWIDKPSQCSAKEAVAQAGERPSSGVLESRRPVAVDVAGADGLVDQPFGLQRSDDASA